MSIAFTPERRKRVEDFAYLMEVTPSLTRMGRTLDSDDLRAALDYIRTLEQRVPVFELD